LGVFFYFIKEVTDDNFSFCSIQYIFLPSEIACPEVFLRASFRELRFTKKILGTTQKLTIAFRLLPNSPKKSYEAVIFIRNLGLKS
jgi:hypothetical protein